MLMFLLMFCQQFSGVATLTYYAVSIMEESGSGIDSYDATILYGVIRSVKRFLEIHCYTMMIKMVVPYPSFSNLSALNVFLITETSYCY